MGCRRHAAGVYTSLQLGLRAGAEVPERRRETVPVETPPPTESPLPSRYQRMREILDRAAAGSTSSYQGYGPFWRLPYAEFLEFSLYGVRMIAPGLDRPKTSMPFPSASRSLAAAPAAVVSIGGLGIGSGSSLAIAAAVPAFGARSSASGLIKGLRGLGPFDGSRFPQPSLGRTGGARGPDRLHRRLDRRRLSAGRRLRRGRHVGRRPSRGSGQG